jgi:protein ImuB
VLWIALHLPFLSLESFAATLLGGVGGVDADPQIALVDEHRISAANAAAQAQGVKPGLKRATALALAPRITLGQADPARDAEALLPVAHAALAFTSQVVLQPANEPGAAPHTVLLEVQASLRYFGGLDALVQRLQQALVPLGHALRIAVAATAQGAAVLARVEPPPRCLDLAATRAALANAPVWLLGPGREHWEALQGMGLRTIGDLLGLPRAGLARRFGELLLAEIDSGFGRRPDPRVPIVAGRLFESRLELFARADSGDRCSRARRCCWRGSSSGWRRRRSFRAPLSPPHAPRDALAAGRSHAAGDGARDRARRAVARRAPPAESCCASDWRGCSCPRRRSSSPCRPKTSSSERRRTASSLRPGRARTKA